MNKISLFELMQRTSKAAGPCALLLMTLFAQSIEAAQTLRLVGDPWPPYVDGVLGEDASSGVAVEIVERLFARIPDAEVRFPLIPWKRALREVEEGHSDGIPILLKTAERESYMVFSDALLNGENLIWYSDVNNASAFEWQEIEDLQGYRIGVTRGYSNGDLIDTSIEQGELKVVQAPNVQQLFAMLANGRVDIVLANDVVGYSLARLYPRAAIKPARKAVLSEVFHIGISKKSAARELLPEINAVIKAMHEEGLIDRILRGD